MLRVRLTAGLVNARQLHGLATLALEAGAPRLHITTRQDLQLHDLSLKAALQVQAGLLKLGLTSFGSGGSTVRNIVAEPLSGITTDEAFDVRPFAVKLASRYTAPSQQPSLPRKLKIAFSASAADRADARLADLGFIAKREGNALGFEVFVGGGLGLGPAVGLLLFNWIPADQVAHVTQGILNLFATLGDRENRNKARLRHLRKRVSDAEFLKLCNKFVADVSPHDNLPEPQLPNLPRAGASKDELPTLASRLPLSLQGNPRIVEEREPGRFSVRLAPQHGDVQAQALLTLAEAAIDLSSSTIRVGLDQDLWLTGLGGAAVSRLLTRLRGLGLGAPDEPTQPIVACSGAATCQLGLLQSRAAADAVASRLTQDGTPWNDEAIRISGCPNACSRHSGAKLGFEGRAKRVAGRLLPSYAVYSGGENNATTRELATLLGVVPAKRLPDVVLALREATSTTIASPTQIATARKAIVDRFAQLPSTIPEDWYRDWGTTGPLDLSELGEGECAATL